MCEDESPVICVIKSVICIQYASFILVHIRLMRLSLLKKRDANFCVSDM